MNGKLLTIIFFSVLTLFIFYKLYTKDNIQLEHFGSLEKMKNIKQKQKLKLKKQSKQGFKNVSKKKATFDDLYTEAEKLHPEKYTIDSMKQSFLDYKESFNKEKFKNNSNSTAEAFEKFAYYKEKFYEIFD